MKTLKFLLTATLLFTLFSCSDKGGKRKTADYSLVKKELNLQGETATKYDAITSKYDQERKAFRETQGEKPDRVVLFSKMEEIQKKQDGEIAALLNAEQMKVYERFVEKNTRKRPRYNDALLARIENEAGLDQTQMQVVNAANNAFEKAYHEAHDVYHGNNDLAAEYWTKYDTQRKAAIEKALTPEQYAAFLTVVKDVKPSNRSEK
ncbi:hypothetical protein [Planobacterium oryzisoli]|uniref:Lipoprotein n=1 Tax=Planobacterium oryzisoli TaxID=2771435 RepID=A0A930YUY7_9FLAO|nr:hypothetical protein [Planobacterium oryzisoli]MBF5026801.1 hypothetical protein [Planobacterium oryzisoli]